MNIVITLCVIFGIVLLGELLDKVGYFEWLNNWLIDKWGE